MSLNSIVKTTGFLAKKYAPQILISTGIVGGISAAVIGAKRTPEAKKESDKIQTINHLAKRGEISEISASKLKVNHYIRIAKIYATPVALGTASVISILASHNIMYARYLAVSEAYKLTVDAFDRYRDRVREELGEEKELKLYLGETTKKLDNPETGKKETVKYLDNPSAMYGAWFDDSSSEWYDDPSYNKFFLRMTQAHFNDMLQVRGYVFLNEVYRALGIPETKAGQIVGWYLPDTFSGDLNELDIRLEQEGRDGYIDFGVFDSQKEEARDFVNGYSNAIFLDFNVDGIIYDKIGVDYVKRNQ